MFSPWGWSDGQRRTVRRTHTEGRRTTTGENVNKGEHKIGKDLGWGILIKAVALLKVPCRVQPGSVGVAPTKVRTYLKKSVGVAGGESLGRDVWLGQLGQPASPAE